MASTKAVDKTLNSPSIDARVMREILQRIEVSQRDARSCGADEASL
ncbi:hypothetical protein [Sinorhizobium meliloti]